MGSIKTSRKKTDNADERTVRVFAKSFSEKMLETASADPETFADELEAGALRDPDVRSDFLSGTYSMAIVAAAFASPLFASRPEAATELLSALLELDTKEDVAARMKVLDAESGLPRALFAASLFGSGKKFTDAAARKIWKYGGFELPRSGSDPKRIGAEAFLDAVLTCENETYLLIRDILRQAADTDDDKLLARFAARVFSVSVPKELAKDITDIIFSSPANKNGLIYERRAKFKSASAASEKTVFESAEIAATAARAILGRISYPLSGDARDRSEAVRDLNSTVSDLLKKPWAVSVRKEILAPAKRSPFATYLFCTGTAGTVDGFDSVPDPSAYADRFDGESIVLAAQATARHFKAEPNMSVKKKRAFVEFLRAAAPYVEVSPAAAEEIWKEIGGCGDRSDPNVFRTAFEEELLRTAAGTLVYSMFDEEPERKISLILAAVEKGFEERKTEERFEFEDRGAETLVRLADEAAYVSERVDYPEILLKECAHFAPTLESSAEGRNLLAKAAFDERAAEEMEI